MIPPSDAWYHLSLLSNGLLVLYRRGNIYLGDVYFDSVEGKWIALIIATRDAEIPQDVPYPRKLAIRMTAQERKIVYFGDDEAEAIDALWASRDEAWRWLLENKSP